MKKITPLAEKVLIPVVGLWIKKVTGLQNIPKEKSFIIAANHASYVEHIMFGCILVPLLNRKIHFIAKKEHFEGLTQSTWHKFWTKYVSYIPIDRQKGEKAIKIALSRLKKGAIIIIYPEGTRTLTGKLQRGKTGTARLAITAKVPIVPVGIIGTFKILPKGSNIPRLKRASFNFGKPIYFKNTKVSKSTLKNATEKIMREIAKLSKQKYVK